MFMIFSYNFGDKIFMCSFFSVIVRYGYASDIKVVTLLFLYFIIFICPTVIRQQVIERSAIWASLPTKLGEIEKQNGRNCKPNSPVLLILCHAY